MHNNITLIAYENTEGGINPLSPLDTETQLPVLPETSPPEQLPSEFEYIAGKSFISFGVMIAAILLLVLILTIIKRKKGNNIEESTNETDKIIETAKEETPKSEEASVPVQSQLPQKPKKNRLSKLSTPNNIQNCIKKFLEITK